MTPSKRLGLGFVLGIGACAFLSTIAPAAKAAGKQRTYSTAKAAAEALVPAAEKYDVEALLEILGPEGRALIVSDDPVLDKNISSQFAAEARKKLDIVPDPKNSRRATLVVGAEDWPMPIPVVERAPGKWSFDTAAGKHEILLRRIGRNELDAIDVCRGYVEAQEEYASEPRGGSRITQYAQRVIGSADRQDGLAWRDPDGTWRGPIGQEVAGAIAEGYSNKYQPYHGYYFKILKGQGPAAPLGRLDYVIKGTMIGGFALVAAPAEYRVTGVKTFIVSNDGVVYERDFGPKTLETFRSMELFNPDRTWHPVEGE